MINLAMFATTDPISFVEAVKSEKWRNAMNLEMESIEKNDTWELIISWRKENWIEMGIQNKA